MNASVVLKAAGTWLGVVGACVEGRAEVVPRVVKQETHYATNNRYGRCTVHMKGWKRCRLDGDPKLTQSYSC